MQPHEIQAELKRNKVTQKDIAEELDKSEMSVSKVINKSMISDEIMRVVARKIKKTAAFVFPEYYHGPKRRSTSKAIGSHN